MYAFFGSFGEWKKVRFLRKFWGMEESTLSSKVLGNGRKYAFFESFLGMEESTLSSKVFRGWKKVRFLLEFFGVGGFGRKYAFF
jgi:predicted alpha/beta hydrolase